MKNMETAKVGSKGEAVRLLQCLLNMPTKQIDGVFGKGTEKVVKDWQTKHGVKPDGIVGIETWKALQEPEVVTAAEYTPITTNITNAPNRNIKYLVIHYTASASSKKGAAANNRLVWLDHYTKDGKLVKGRIASADFIVDDETILQANPAPHNYFCWAVGDGNGKYGITNKDCVSIEICSSKKAGTSFAVPNHEGWYFTEESLNNAIKLAKVLMQTYNIPIERVIRHYDASHKACPGILGWNPGVVYNATTGKATARANTEESWEEFKKRLQS